MSKKPETRTIAHLRYAQPRELQRYGTVAWVPVALDSAVRVASVENLNQLLADTIMLRDLYQNTTGKSAVRRFTRCT